MTTPGPETQHQQGKAKGSVHARTVRKHPGDVRRLLRLPHRKSTDVPCLPQQLYEYVHRHVLAPSLPAHRDRPAAHPNRPLLHLPGPGHRLPGTLAQSRGPFEGTERTFPGGLPHLAYASSTFAGSRREATVRTRMPLRRGPREGFGAPRSHRGMAFGQVTRPRTAVTSGVWCRTSAPPRDGFLFLGRGGVRGALRLTAVHPSCRDVGPALYDLTTVTAARRRQFQRARTYWKRPVRQIRRAR